MMKCHELDEGIFRALGWSYPCDMSLEMLETATIIRCFNHGWNVHGNRSITYYVIYFKGADRGGPYSAGSRVGHEEYKDWEERFAKVKGWIAHLIKTGQLGEK